MEHAIDETTQEVEDVLSGLQAFGEHLPEQNTRIPESIQELVALYKGLLQLRIEHAKLGSMPSHVMRDVDLLLRSMRLTMKRVKRMFGKTRSIKLTGERPYAQVWFDLCHHFEENEDGLLLWPRLELYSLFLKEILEYLRGIPVDRTSLAEHRQSITKLLHHQMVGLSPPGPGPTSPAHSPMNGQFPFPPMPGAWPEPYHFTAPDPARHTVPLSPTMSSASWNTQGSSQTGGSIGSIPSHWASNIFDGQASSSKFPIGLWERSECHGRPLPDAMHRLVKGHYYLVAQLTFDFGVHAQFYCQARKLESRLLLLTPSPTGYPLLYCSRLQGLKIVRKKACLELHRDDQAENAYVLWAKLCFPDYERLVLFYSTFAALKAQDNSAPLDDSDYFYQPNEEQFGAPTVYDSKYRHAVRIFFDQPSNALRLEARPLRGPRKHVPLWTAFVGDAARQRGSQPLVRRVGPRKVEIRRVRKYVFFDEEDNGAGPRKLLLLFEREDDAENFVGALIDLSS